jgi:DNA-binding transcriptional MerR regulator
MATFPLATCARILGIHPKTLHHWLAETNLPLATHPTDARIKCMTEDHLLQVARLHRRPLPDLPSAALRDGCSALGSREEQAELLSANEPEPAHPAPSVAEVDLFQKLSCLETKIGTLQEQLAQLALGLLHERERTVEHRIAALEALIQALVGGHMLADPQEQGARQEPACVWQRGHQPLAVEQRARSRMPALIEYGAQGTYVIISSQEGELPLAPDSAEWFEWLASISSFRFVGRQGRFTAYRDTKHGSPTRSWRAYRTIHQRNYKCSLGVTDGLTLACLEQAAAPLQAHVPSL